MRRLLLVIVFAAVLGATLIYSQMRPVTYRVSGFVEADEIRLGSRVGGRIKSVLVEEGSRVNAGQILLELEPYDLEQRLAEAESVLQAKESELAKLKAGNRPEEIAQAVARVANLQAVYDKLLAGPREEEIAEATAQVALAEAQLVRAQRSYERLKSLFDQSSGSVSRDEMDRSMEEFKVAQAQLQTQNEGLILLQKGNRHEDIAAAKAMRDEADAALKLAQAGFRSEDIAQAHASVMAAKAQVDALRTQLAELKIHAPVAGTIAALEFRPGDLTSPNGPVVTLLDDERLWVRTYVPENRLNMAIGDRYRITVDSFPDQDFTGEVTFIASQAEFTPRNVQTPEERSKQVFRVKLNLLNKPLQLRPGMAVDVWLDDKLSAEAAK